MNAALEAICADRCIRASRSRTFFSRASGNENYCSKIQALGSRNGITGNSVKFNHESATKIRDASKCMYLAATILDQCRASNIDVHLAWLVSPLMSVLGFFEFLNELSESRVPITNAGAVAQNLIESRGFAIVEQPDLFITLNGASAYSETQQSKSSERRPECGSKSKPSFHMNLDLLDAAVSLVGARQSIGTLG
jgi:hypothetical protein